MIWIFVRYLVLPIRQKYIVMLATVGILKYHVAVFQKSAGMMGNDFCFQRRARVVLRQSSRPRFAETGNLFVVRTGQNVHKPFWLMSSY